MIRSSTPEDREEYLRICMAIHDESSYAFIPVNVEKLNSLFDAVHEPDSSIFLQVSEENGKLNGMIYGYLAEYFFSDEVGGYDLFFYVAPEKRGSTIAVRLWRAFRDWCIARGCLEMCHGVSTEIDGARAGKFMMGMGMRDVGGLYKMRLPNEPGNPPPRPPMPE